MLSQRQLLLVAPCCAIPSFSYSPKFVNATSLIPHPEKNAVIASAIFLRFFWAEPAAKLAIPYYYLFICALRFENVAIFCLSAKFWDAKIRGVWGF